MNPLSALVGRHIEAGAREAVKSGPIPGLLRLGARGYGAVAGMHPLDRGALATAPVPVLGDAVGLAADARMFAQEPESRNPLNFGLSALGALPFVPALSTAKRMALHDRVRKHGSGSEVLSDLFSGDADAPARIADELGVDVAPSEVAEAARLVREETQRLLSDAPQKFTVWRGGPIRGGVVPVTTNRAVAERFAARNGGELIEATVDKSNVLADVTRFLGESRGFDEAELLVPASALEAKAKVVRP